MNHTNTELKTRPCIINPEQDALVLVIGNKSSLIDAMMGLEKTTATELAGTVNLPVRLVTDWLVAMTVCGYVYYDFRHDRFSLNHDQFLHIATAEFTMRLVAAHIPQVNRVLEDIEQIFEGDGFKRVDQFSLPHVLEWLGTAVEVGQPEKPRQQSAVVTSIASVRAG